MTSPVHLRFSGSGSSSSRSSGCNSSSGSSISSSGGSSFVTRLLRYLTLFNIERKYTKRMVN
jgi:hypothetical protein